MNRSAKQLKAQLRGMAKLREAVIIMGWTAVQVEDDYPGLLIGPKDFCMGMLEIIKEALQPEKSTLAEIPAFAKAEELKAPISEEGERLK